MSGPAVRALAAQDGVVARALVQVVHAGTRQLVRTLELLELALPGGDPECQGVVSTGDDGSVGALIFFGPVGGAAGVVKLHTLVGSTANDLEVLIGELRGTRMSRDARMFICELSAEQDALAYRALTSTGFALEARVADYFADGVALDVLVLRHTG